MLTVPDWLDADRVVALATVLAVLATVASLAYTRSALREAREQRHQGLLPILVVTRSESRGGADGRAGAPPAEEDAGRRAGTTVDRGLGVRIENAGPGVALDVAAAWVLDPALPRGAVSLDNAEPPTALAPGASHAVRVTVNPRELARLEQAAARGGTASREVVATVALVYADVYGRAGRTTARVLLASVGLHPVLTVDELRISRPGEHTPTVDLSPVHPMEPE